ncbi:phage portal protein [Pedobacter panaciterrae]|uniref:Phage portal protein n=1 Tax=Pedobacter panaciterrae TaxID=363849 RepID=A0ABU8NS23_9SPHI
MELSTIKTLLTDPVKLISKIKDSRPDAQKDLDNAKDILIDNHNVMNPAERKKREVNYDTGLVNDKDEPIMRKEYEEVARIPSAIEKQIVTWAVQAAVGEPVEIHAKPNGDIEQTMYDMISLICRDNKTEFLDQEILRLTATYTCCAEIWYLDDAEPNFWTGLGFENKQKASMMIMSAETGDTLYPVRNANRKMLCLGREYTVKDDENKEVKSFDLYFSDYILTYVDQGTGWKLKESFKVEVGKATFIFHSQPATEWADILPKRDRLERLDSDHADQNLATGSPILVADRLIGAAKRGETGKMFEVENGGSIDMLEAAGAPESLAMERKNLLKGIFYESQTPDMSLFDADGMGANTPGITLKLMFTPTSLKAKARHSGEFGMCYQRRINLLKYFAAYINPNVKPALQMVISPKFKVYMPSNDTEEYQNIVSLVGAGLMSKDTAIRKLAFTDDPDTEYEKIKEEVAEAKKLITEKIIVD